MYRTDTQNLKDKLHRRFECLKSSREKFFDAELRKFWQFLGEQPMLAGIIQELDCKVDEPIKAKIHGELFCAKPWMFESEEEEIKVSYYVIKWCIEEGGRPSPSIGYMYHELSDLSNLENFKSIFLEPFFNYLNEQIDDVGFILSLLQRYQHQCEWFRGERLYSIWKDETKKGEKRLGLDLYEYLYDKGIDFFLEPASISGEIDLIEAQKSDGSQKSEEPLLLDAKIFNPGKGKGKSYIINGFGQLYTYTCSYNKPSGFLVIFKTSEEELKFNFNENLQMVPFTRHNNKTIFFLVIDIYPYERSASKRGKPKCIEIAENDLWSEVP